MSPATCPAGWGSMHKNDIGKNVKKKSPSMLCGQLHVANCNIRVKTVGLVVNCQMLKTTVLETLAQHGSPCTYFNDQGSATRSPGLIAVTCKQTRSIIFVCLVPCPVLSCETPPVDCQLVFLTGHVWKV